MKETQIICTIGPASGTEEVLQGMLDAGMDIVRFNFSHGTYEEQKDRMDLVKKVCKNHAPAVLLMLDTKGPEFRIGKFEAGKIYLNPGDSFTFTIDDVIGTQERVSVSYKNLPAEMEVGDIILVNDGLVKLEVQSKSEKEIHCQVITGGKLSNLKSMSFPGKTLKQIYLSAQDKSDLLFGIENGVNMVACSFVSCAQDIIDVRNFLDGNGGRAISLVAKIENQSGVDNAEAILDHCEGLMVARGDLGVEIDYYKVPVVQKELIRLCRTKGKFSITATEMLESMIEKPRPTRAEVSDVANAVFDGSDAIMLSGETAAGKYPVEAVKAMALISAEAEKHTYF